MEWEPIRTAFDAASSVLSDAAGAAVPVVANATVHAAVLIVGAVAAVHFELNARYRRDVGDATLKFRHPFIDMFDVMTRGEDTRGVWKEAAA